MKYNTYFRSIMLYVFFILFYLSFISNNLDSLLRTYALLLFFIIIPILGVFICLYKTITFILLVLITSFEFSFYFKTALEYLLDTWIPEQLKFITMLIAFILMSAIAVKNN